MFQGILFLIRVGFIIFIEWIYNTSKQELLIERIAHKLVNINILFVKVFQAIALNNHLIDETIGEKLTLFTNNAPWKKSIDLDENVIQILNDKYNIELSNVINSGMISLVFKGIDKKTGELFAVKIKRKNIEERLESSLNELMYLVYLISFFFSPINELVHKNIGIIRQQTDFSLEVENMKLFKQNCRRLNYIKVPSIKDDITSELQNVIVMEFINGKTIKELSREDYEPFAKQVIKFGLVTSIMHGVTHGDLHSGNILFIKNDKLYQLGILDFGIVYHLNSSFKENMFVILSEMFNKTPRETAIKFLNSGLIYPENAWEIIDKPNYEKIISFTEMIIQETITDSKKANQAQIYSFLIKLKDYLSRPDIIELGIRPSDDFIKSQLVIAMAHGITMTLCEKMNYIELLDKVMNELFHINMLL